MSSTSKRLGSYLPKIDENLPDYMYNKCIDRQNEIVFFLKCDGAGSKKFRLYLRGARKIP